MNSLAIILLMLLAGSILTYSIDTFRRKLAGWMAFATLLTTTVYFYSKGDFADFSFQIGGIKLKWGLSALRMFFANIVLILSVLALLYSIEYMKGKARLGYFYASFVMTILGMFGVIISKDFVSLFIFWEIMTWSSFLLIIYNAYYKIKTEGLKYMVFSAIGAYAMLTAIVFIYHYYGTFDIATAIDKGVFSFENHVFIPIFLALGFAVKAAVMPFHVWAPSGYAKSPMSFTAVFSGAMSKMGVFGLLLVFATYYSSHTSGAYVFTQILAWLGGITAVMGTIYALIQKDAKKLLAYSSVAQLGYIVVALSTGTKLGVMAALYLAVLHAAFKGSLFMVAGAVEKQAGTTNMTKISGLIRKMPWTFFVALVSIISLAGVPPLGGFIGKWLLYEALITESHNYFLVIVIFFSSTAAFMYAYRFLFGLFLGQEEKETENVKEAPLTMLIPMVILALVSIVTGAMPGLIFKPAAAAMQNIGFSSMNWQMSVLSNVWGNHVDMSLIGLFISVVFVLIFAFLTLKGRKTTRQVGTKDISSSGELWKEGENWTFQQDFFKPFERAAAPFYKWKMNDIWEDLGNALEAFFNFFRRIYTGNGQTYAMYVIGFLVLLILFRDYIFK